jgi:antitoxin (DNA-binding transcriptional repressor) of toxin-antitoxin stability system
MVEYAGNGPVEVVHHPGDPQGSPLRVRSGTEIVITLHGSPAYGWTPIEVVAGLLAVIEAGSDEETTTATVRATGPGEAELRSTSSFRGDRFGPRTRLWRLLVSVEP